MTEIWRDIYGYEGYYEVSSFGRVRSLDRPIWNGSGYYTLKGKILNPTINGKGYYTVSLLHEGVRQSIAVHILVAIAFHDHVPDGMNIIVDHKDGIKLNNNKNNLQIISQRLNTSKDKVGSSKYTGVSWQANANKWRVQIRLPKDTKNLHLGLFENEDVAGQQYKKALDYILSNDLKKDSITAKELRTAIL